jgi:hypothetical protein
MICACLAAMCSDGVARQASGKPPVSQTPDGRVRAGDLIFDSWNDYANSGFFRQHGMRCGLPESWERPVGQGGVAGGSGADCTVSFTNPDEVYAPSFARTGDISEALINSQIDILNEDFLALPGSNGAMGNTVEIEFFLATEDPMGNPTNGITYSNNTNWFNDTGNYWDPLAWDPNRYINIYTNTAGGNLGYVPFLPQEGPVGSNSDRVVMLWSTIGLDAPIGPPFDKGRTLTHEIGHFLGLLHTFDGGCGSADACFTTGDLICDTNPEATPAHGCTEGGSCGSPDPIHNYMDYSDDLCMFEFTPQQARRIRCSLENYRPALFELVGSPTGACCMGATCTISSPGECAAAGGEYQGDGSMCNPCTPPMGACCTDGACAIDTEAGCAASGGNYRGDGTTCEGDPCAAPTGACCTGTACSIDTQANCAAAGGDYLGDGSTCAGDPCTKPVGACCSADGTCTLTTEAMCAGEYQGNGTTCDPNPCPIMGACGDPASGDCSVANGTPFCDDAKCCQAVCAADAFCCETEWDQLCADLTATICLPTGACCDGNGACTIQTEADCAAIGTYEGDGTTCTPDPCSPPLPQCGDAAAGDCFEANGNAACDDKACCNEVCALDPFCCEELWDQLCAESAAKSCDPGPSCGDPETGDCLSANGSPFCENAACCETVCADDPFCCDTEWDQVCADLAAELCAPAPVDCGDPNAGDCNVANGTPFCENADCCDEVCGFDPFCCEVEWDEYCAQQAAEVCTGGGKKEVCGDPDAGDCLTANGSPGCEDAECCAAICAVDPFCCETDWDFICVKQTSGVCDGGGSCFGDTDDNGAVDVDDLVSVILDWGRRTEGTSTATGS